MNKIILSSILALLSLNLAQIQAMAQEAATPEAPYRGGSGDGYAMAEIRVHSIPTGVNKALEEAVRLYPNPLKQGDQLVFQAPSSLQIEKIRLIDAQGNLLFEQLQKNFTAKATEEADALANSNAGQGAGTGAGANSGAGTGASADSGSGSGSGGDNIQLHITSEAWPAGIYFLQLEGKGSTITKKLILL